MLGKIFEPAAIEAKWYPEWEKSGAFRCDPTSGKTPYTIMMPPPNVTGSLHMGHALTFTLQDILVRYHRMKGYDVLWQPGTDHAGIATQMVVERQLESQQITRHDLGREKFIEKVWEWKAESGGTIINQLRRLGASADWQRERFTMDEGLSKAVRKVFVRLFKEGLIYRDKRLVNWDPRLLTAISDLEVEPREVKGKLWHFRYMLADGSGRSITVATTRPETMLGDTAVAVHPEDERFRDLVGQMVELPLVGRLIPIIADEYSDPEKGTGAVKITPAHDFNDFEVGKRHNLEMINVLDREARMNENAPEAYRGLDRYKAREKIAADIEALGLLVEIEDHPHTVPHGDRSGVAIEPWLTDQWFCDAATLAKPALEAVETGKTAFVPKQWEKTYYEWMRNIQPWCVSRQLWWGHQIPAWYGPDGKIFVERSEDEAMAAARSHYARDVEVIDMEAALARWDAGGEGAVALYRDEDVLDTWFSSALWPFSTLGWPDKTPELANYYPTSVLITGFDIIFFWVARMMMLGDHYMKTEPFHTVYIHALVRDEKGQKMSKSKGNVIDPLALIDEYGADALRFTLAAMAAQGRDIKLATGRVAGYRNFVTKLWNAARFVEMNGGKRPAGFDPVAVRETVNRWIVTETGRCIAEVTEALEGFRFNEAAGAAYRFVWNTYCDWYLELAKPIFGEGSEDAREETRATAAWVLDEVLKVLHPFMPFMTEELWARAVEGDAEATRERLLVHTRWPVSAGGDQSSASEINWLVDLITSIRSVRAEMNVPAGARVPLVVTGANEVTRQRLATHEAAILRLARAESVSLADAPPRGSVQIVSGEAVFCLPLADFIDLGAEAARLAKEEARLDGEIARIDKKLGNPAFVAKAPEEIVVAEQEKRAELVELRDKVVDARKRLADLSHA
jgi:valyl-tRNA synthetase